MTTNGRNGGTAGDAERDPRLDRLYRGTAREEPPARLDAAILAAARREVSARPRAVSARLRAWRVPVSVAALVVLSVSLVTLMREEGGGQLEQPPAMDRPSRSAESTPASQAAASAEQAKAPAAAPAVKEDAAPGATASAKVGQDASRRAAGPSAPRPAAPEPRALPPQPFPAAPASSGPQPTLSDQAAGTGAARQSAGIRGGEAESSAPAAPAAAPRPAARLMQRDGAATGAAADSAGAVQRPAPDAAAEESRPRAEARASKSAPLLADTARVAALVRQFELQSPERWLEKIEALRREGQKGDADAMLAEFKRRFPDHPLPPGLR